MVQFLTGEVLKRSQCSKELKRLGFTRKKLAHLSRRRDEAQRVSWWTSPPMPPVPGGPRGVHGLDTRLLIDIDEKPIWLHHCNRQYGHALQGQRGVVHRARGPREGRKATLLLVCFIAINFPVNSLEHAANALPAAVVQAVDQQRGVVASWCFFGNCNESVFLIFLLYKVFPQIVGQQRFLM
eukprot:COSAG02_NODE_1374_length_13005_cov_5.606152_7_plen_182_part_00